MKCSKCGHDEYGEYLKNIRTEHEQCFKCKWWTCGGAVGSYCDNPSSIVRNFEGNCGYFE